MNRIYFLSTEHLENSLWFREDEDFKVGMNYVAIEVARKPNVSVLSFILMSNHVHFVLKGTREDAIAFVEDFKMRYSKYYSRKYGITELLRRNRIDIREIPYQDEAVEKAIAYVHMNAVVANICASPNQYPWGTGNTIFNPTPSGGTPVGKLSIREKRRLLRSYNPSIPGEWLIGNEGYILPRMYINVRGVEAIFRSAKRMNYFLSTSSKAKKRLEANENLPAFRDQSILTAIPDLCRSLFQKERFSDLLPNEQSEFLRQLQFRFSSDANQLARVCGLTYKEAAQMLDREN